MSDKKEAMVVFSSYSHLAIPARIATQFMEHAVVLESKYEGGTSFFDIKHSKVDLSLLPADEVTAMYVRDKLNKEPGK